MFKKITSPITCFLHNVNISMDNMELRPLFSQVPSVKELIDQTNVTYKPIGKSYEEILAILKSFWQERNILNKINIAFNLYELIHKYIDSHPKSERNTALLSLKKDLTNAINSLDHKTGLSELELDCVKAYWKLQILQLQSINNYTPESQLGSLLQENDYFDEIQTPFDKKKKNKEVQQAKDIKLDDTTLGKLNSYLEDLKWYSREGYQYINESLRSGIGLNFDAKRYSNIINCLKSLPVYRGTIYRALPVDNLNIAWDNLKPGLLVGDKGFLSTSSSIEFAKNFRGGKKTIIYIIKGDHQGRNISLFTQLEQGEVVLLPGCHMQIKSTKLTNSNLYVLMESINKFQSSDIIYDLKDGRVIGTFINENETTLHYDINELTTNLADSFRANLSYRTK